jgi:multiple sugar transport system substrate-binding protein
MLAMAAIIVLAVLAACGGSSSSGGSDTTASDTAGTTAGGPWSLSEAAKPYKGTSITVLDEVTDLQPALRTLIPQFEKETGIKVDYQLAGHLDVIRKGEADLLSGRGSYDAVMVHSVQKGRILSADVVQPIND